MPSCLHPVRKTFLRNLLPVLSVGFVIIVAEGYSSKCQYAIEPEMVGYSNWPAGFTKSWGSFQSAAFDGTSIWMAPYAADRVVRIYTATGRMESYTWPDGFSGGSFSGAIFDGSSVWLIPNGADRVIRINTTTGVMTGYNVWPDGYTKGNWAFAGGVWDGTSVWMVPHDADRVIRNDTSTGIVYGYQDWPSGFYKNLGTFNGGVFDGSYVWLVAWDAYPLMRVNITSGEMEMFYNYPSGFIKFGHAWSGGVFDGSHIWLMPAVIDSVVRLDPLTGVMDQNSTWPAGFVKGAYGFVGGAFDGSSVWMVPNTANQLVRVNISNWNMTGYNNWPPGFSWGGDPPFCAGIFDGRDLWLIPHNANQVVRVRLVATSCTKTLTPPPTSSDSFSPTEEPSQTEESSFTQSLLLTRTLTLTSSLLPSSSSSLEPTITASTSLTPWSTSTQTFTPTPLGTMTLSPRTTFSATLTLTLNPKLPCQSSTCNGKGNVTGNLREGCNCICDDGYDNRTNCSTRLATPSPVLSDRANPYSDASLAGCNDASNCRSQFQGCTPAIAAQRTINCTHAALCIQKRVDCINALAARDQPRCNATTQAYIWISDLAAGKSSYDRSSPLLLSCRAVSEAWLDEIYEGQCKDDKYLSIMCPAPVFAIVTVSFQGEFSFLVAPKSKIRFTEALRADANNIFTTPTAVSILKMAVSDRSRQGTQALAVQFLLLGVSANNSEFRQQFVAVTWSPYSYFTLTAALYRELVPGGLLLVLVTAIGNETSMDSVPNFTLPPTTISPRSTHAPDATREQVVTNSTRSLGMTLAPTAAPKTDLEKSDSGQTVQKSVLVISVVSLVGGMILVAGLVSAFLFFRRRRNSAQGLKSEATQTGPPEFQSQSTSIYEENIEIPQNADKLSEEDPPEGEGEEADDEYSNDGYRDGPIERSPSGNVALEGFGIV